MIAETKKGNTLSRLTSPISLFETETNPKRHPTLVIKMKRMKTEEKAMNNVRKFLDDNLHKAIVFLLFQGKTTTKLE